MSEGVATRRPLYPMLAVFALQVFCAIFFAGDALFDVMGWKIAGRRDRTDAFEWVIAAALFIGVAVTGREILRLVRRNASLARQVRAASGEFSRLIEEHFDAWGLTNAERDVALLSIKGLSVAEIAVARGTAEGTVKAHSAAVYRKAGVSGRMQLLSLFVDELIDGPVLQKKSVGN